MIIKEKQGLKMWREAGQLFFIGKDIEFEELPKCQNCGIQVPDDFPSLGHKLEDNWTLPCCSQNCVNLLFEKIHRRKPSWMKYKNGK